MEGATQFMNELTNLISNVGFPIVACVFMYKSQQEMSKTINELSVTLKGIDTRIQGLEDTQKIKMPK